MLLQKKTKSALKFLSVAKRNAKQSKHKENGLHSLKDSFDDELSLKKIQNKIAFHKGSLPIVML